MVLAEGRLFLGLVRKSLLYICGFGERTSIFRFGGSFSQSFQSVAVLFGYGSESVNRSFVWQFIRSDKNPETQILRLMELRRTSGGARQSRKSGIMQSYFTWVKI